MKLGGCHQLLAGGPRQGTLNTARYFATGQVSENAQENCEENYRDGRWSWW
ncbi:hypothetical protein [Dysosmobacter welbionis]|uniref:hypothetical protein n=1 Tax=Dysosmobacter welbionis TaxID=2093857 RepID=UPI00300EBD9F